MQRETKQENEIKYRNFKQIVNTFYNEEIEDISGDEEQELKDKGKIKIEPKIIYDKFTGEMKAQFKIGETKMYKIKSLSDFYTRMLNKEFYKYGEKLKFIHTQDAFEEKYKDLLDFILRYSEIIKYANSDANFKYKYYGKSLSESSITLGNSGLDNLFEILKENEVEFQKDSENTKIKLTEEEPKIEFVLKKVNDEKYVITPNIDIFKVTIIKGKNYKYILDDKKLYRCSKRFENTNLKLLELFRQNYITEIELGEKELYELFSIVVPKVKDAIKISENLNERLDKYKPKNLGVKVYLDFDDMDYLTLDARFCYEDNEFNPLDEKIKFDFPRNMIQETKVLNVFRKSGFMFDVKNYRFILPDNDKIYQFLLEDINYYMQKFEVLVTDRFKTKQIKESKISGLGVRIDNNLLEIDFKKIDIDIKEIKEILNRYSLKKKYYRLKDGSFLSLEQNKDIEFLDKLVTGMDVDLKELEEGTVKLPIYRSMYLDSLLKGIKGTEIIKNSKYREVVNSLNKDNLEEDITVPNELENVLRYYQKSGIKWLKTLDQYKFGGILADDMGLGKTLQMIAVIVDYVQNSEANNKKTSIVVSPSSLTLNWQNEVRKFASKLKTIVIRGSLEERKQILNEIDNYDLVITSYDLLKRDIELYKEKAYKFKYVIADEAQYLKNSNTQNAKAIKQLKGETRFALTGTPIENSLSELWSIFDFIMPGYLFNYRKFKNTYELPIIRNEDKNSLEKLKLMISPFILRRNKQEVLKELPEKTITVLNNEMGEEQKNIYLTYLSKAKRELAEEFDLNGIENSHIQILAALTRLRQICCHPSLFIDNYNDQSSKLEQCMEIIKEAVNGNHKILLFSGYTSMFEIIEERLKEANIKYFKLTGSTKVDERINLVDEFNENKDIKVFLISLKAGGTGLNLTGADMVIHYDPWWNISIENQATDRAYRIGQKNNVQVYKLITKDSIEEKIYELQQKKSRLADSMLDTKASFINKLSKEEIMYLFEE